MINSVASSDIIATIKRYELVGMLGWQDVRQRYRRSALGPFWITINMAVMITSIGLVFGHFFGTPMTEFLPFLAVGMIIWGMISTTLSDGCLGFIAAEGIIKQLPIPLFVHILRVIWRNFLIFAHNIIILPIVFLAMGKPLTLIALLSIPGLLLLIINLAWASLLLGIFCARYRDFPQVITNLLQVIFYLTPIMWMTTSLPQRAGAYILNPNPFYHSLEIIRAPLWGQAPAMTHWIVVSLLALLGWGLTLIVYGRYKNRIAYWL